MPSKTGAPAVPAAAPMTDDHFAAIKRQGRPAEPSPYTADVQASAADGQPRSISVADKSEATKVLNYLRKAGEQLGVKLQTWNRQETHGFVGFKVKSVDDADADA